MPGDFIEVELEFDDEPSTPATPAKRTKPPRPRRKPWSLRRWGTIALGCALAVAASTAVQSSLAVTTAHVVGAPGLVDDLLVPRHEVWRAGGRPIGQIGGLVLLEGQTMIRAVDLRSGEIAWSAEQVGCYAYSMDDPYLFGRTVASIEPDQARVVCGGFETASTVVLDGEGAQVLSTGTQADGAYAFVSGEYLIAASPEVPYSIRVWSMRTGEELWSYTPMVQEVGLQMPELRTNASDQLFVSTLDGWHAMDLATGEPEDAGDLGMQVSVPFCDDVTIEVRQNFDGESSVAVRDGEQVRWERTGWYIGLVDDPLGSCDLVPLLEDSYAVVVVDAATGETVVEDDALFGLMLEIRGLLVVVNVDPEGATANITAYDTGTGTERWSVPTEVEQVYVTDGWRFATVESGRAVIRDLGSGAQVTGWDLPYSGDSYLEQLPDGALVQVTSTETILLAP